MNNDQCVPNKHRKIISDVIEGNFKSAVSEAARRLSLNKNSPIPRGNGLLLYGVAYDYGVSLVALGRALQRRKMLKQREAAPSAGWKQLNIWD